jgi:hypothetical protein
MPVVVRGAEQAAWLQEQRESPASGSSSQRSERPSPADRSPSPRPTPTGSSRPPGPTCRCASSCASSREGSSCLTGRAPASGSSSVVWPCSWSATSPSDAAGGRPDRPAGTRACAPPLPARYVRRVHGRRRAPERRACSLPLRALHRPPRRRRSPAGAARGAVGGRACGAAGARATGPPPALFAG